MTRTLAALTVVSWLSGGAPAVAADFQVGNDSRSIGSRRWEWTVFIIAPASVLDRIKCVEYTLHPTFPDPIHVICDRGPNAGRAFPLSASGWGEFEIGVKVTYTNGRVETARHWLQLQTAAGAPPAPVKGAASLCPLADQRSLTEDSVWMLPIRSLYLYVEELHRGRPADIVVFSTNARIDAQSFDWDDAKRRLRPVRPNQPLASESYVTLQVPPMTLARVPLAQRASLQFFVNEAVRGAAQIGLCR